ncbi:MAG: AI-2E family transporter [Candidatus Eremiobacteraeota bacterium]|nr:AI-2E family transporter [Candidatus Eremiobacteraeota bacterium]
MASNIVDRISNVLTIIVFSILFSYLIYPAVKLFSRRMPRPLAVALVYAGIFVAVVVALAFLAPTVAAQADDFARDYPATVRGVQHSISDPAQNPILQRFPPQVRALVATNAGKVGSYAAVAATAVGTHLLPLLQGGATLVTELAVTFGVTFMFIVDLEKIQATLIRVFPRASRPYVVKLVMDIDSVIGGFVRSQVLLALVVAAATILVLEVTGVPYALLLGLLIGVLSIVPIVGAIVGAIPAVLVALFTVGLIKAIVIVVLFAVIFQVVSNLVAPLVSAKSVGVTPLIVTLAILIGGEAYGILGILLSVPIAGIVRVVFDRLFPADPESERLVLSARTRSGDVTQPAERA